MKENKMTKFVKENFNYHGGFLMYEGEHDLSEYYSEPCHPSRLGKPRDTFVARFKYGKKNWKTWVTFLVNNFTVEEYVEMEKATSPYEAMQSKGFSRF